jgi:hypothetical protein
MPLEFSTATEKIQNSTDAIVKEDCQQNGHKNKCWQIKSHRIPDTNEVRIWITAEAQERFQSTNHLDASRHLHSVNFDNYSKTFPNSVLHLTVETYPMLNKNRFQTELSVLYERQDIQNINAAIPLLQLTCCNNLQDTFSGTTTPLRIVKIPTTTAFISEIKKKCSENFYE